MQEIATPPTLPPTLETSDQWRNRPYRFVSGFNGGILNIRGCAIKYRASREYFGEACNRFERARSRGSLSRNCFHRAGHNFSFLSPLLFFTIFAIAFWSAPSNFSSFDRVTDCSFSCTPFPPWCIRPTSPTKALKYSFDENPSTPLDFPSSLTTKLIAKEFRLRDSLSLLDLIFSSLFEKLWHIFKIYRLPRFVSFRIVFERREESNRGC